MAKTWICDWSHWQGVLPAKTVEDEGFGMVKLKVGGSTKEGWSFIDPTFAESAIALGDTNMLKAVYWYLMPGLPTAQAAILYDMLRAVGGTKGWGICLDVEREGLNRSHVEGFILALHKLCWPDNVKLWIYTRRSFWVPRIDMASGVFGGTMAPTLEEARWIPENVRMDPANPYASQQAHWIQPAWWDVYYSGWDSAKMLQFTDNAKVAGKFTTASLYRGTQDELRKLVITE
jgi:hypothetical protein